MIASLVPGSLPRAGGSLLPEIVSSELPNGLQILAAADASAPVVSIQYWCATGSIHEGRWLGAGLSHLLEHLLFKGTPSRGNSGMAREIQDLGGHLNAYTSFDRTVYYADLPAENWKAALAILTDAVQHSLIPAEEFEPEKEVIRREFAMGDDNPDSVLMKLAFRTVFTTHPYRFPVIGHIDLFNRLTRDDVVSYYRERYAPQNLTLVVCGAVDAQAVADEAARLWKEEPRRFLPDVTLPPEPAQQSPRAVRRPFPTEVTRLALLHPIPGFHHPDIPALQLLAVILGGGRSSLLHQLLVEKEGLAEEVDAFAYAPGQAGLFGVDARCQPQNGDKVAARLREELQRFAEKGPSQAELDRAQRLCLTQQIQQLKSMSGKASAIGGGWRVARDPRLSQTFLDRLQAVTVADVAAAARRYLDPRTESLVELVPQEKEAPAAAGAPAAAAEPPLPQKLAAATPRSLYLPQDRLPLFTLRAALPGGLLSQPEGKSGLCRLASQLLLKGTKRRSAEEIAREVESLGGSLSADSGNNSASLHLELLSQDWETGLELFLDVLTEARCDAKELEIERRKHLAAIALEQDQPMALARDLVRGALYPGHPYAHGILGAAAEVAALTQKDVADYVASAFRRPEWVLGVAGPVPPEKWMESISRRAAFSGGTPPVLPPLPAFPGKGPIRVFKETPKEQAVLQIVFPTVPAAHPDQIPLSLIAEALSDLGTRLFVRIREQLGLAYFVSATRFLGAAGGYFCFYAGTDPKKKELVEAAMLEEIAKLAEGGLTAPEIERARAKLLSEEQIDSQNPGGVVAASALDELLGLGYDEAPRRRARLRALTAEEINAACRKYFGTQEFVVATVSPA
ncbi:MAG: pitrilysin family protein [Verrucomicrobium sp.]|nr:pitrilysin family protein [Verrucomicrobium sp.]